jgi:hypothetical protein
MLLQLSAVILNALPPLMDMDPPPILRFPVDSQAAVLNDASTRFALARMLCTLVAHRVAVSAKVKLAPNLFLSRILSTIRHHVGLEASVVYTGNTIQASIAIVHGNSLPVDSFSQGWLLYDAFFLKK